MNVERTDPYFQILLLESMYKIRNIWNKDIKRLKLKQVKTVKKLLSN